jgi:hypothetical protein
MQIPVLAEQLAGNRYRVRAGEPFTLIAEGTTSAEALQKLRGLIEGRLARGARLVQLEIKSAEPPWGQDHPLLHTAGRLDPNDPMVREWEEIMAENRRKADEDPDYL